MLRDIKEFKLPEIEEQVLAFWKTANIFGKSLQKNKDGKEFVFFEGPPYANGKPGIHHVLARAFKDVIPRYKTMQGYLVPRRAGWDTHGLPVEIAAEKELGIKTKDEIEKVGIAEFNSVAKKLVWKYKTEWEELTERMGFWLDLERPYITYENSYIESLWWVLKEIHKTGLLRRLMRIVPWCPRCQTPLSSHELGQPDVYKATKDPSVYVKFKLTTNNKRRTTESKSSVVSRTSSVNEYLLVWTTTPWTLPANLAVAVNPKRTYMKFKVTETASGKVEYLWSHNPPPAREGFIAVPAGEKKASQLIGLKYEPLYSLKNIKLKTADLFKVIAGDFVATEEGTGLVHMAPAFGEDDFAVMGLKENIPVTIDDRAHVVKGLPGAGKYIKGADKDITADLMKRGLMYQAGELEHEYPYCWRCNSALVYMARESWFIEMSKLRGQLVKNNEAVNWTPSHIKNGRFGEWIKEAKDWSISRNRFWGTPLPIWECGKCEKDVVISGLDDLNAYAPTKNTFFMMRHGEAEHNVADVIASGPEKGSKISKLTEKGIEQIEELAEKIKKEKINLIVVSPYARTKHTARIVAKVTKARVVVDKRLGELNTGVFNWQSVGTYHRFFASREERFSKAVEKGETLAQVRARVVECVRDLNKKYNGKKILIISHGDPLWLLEGAMRGLTKPTEYINDGFYPGVDKPDYYPLTVPNWPFDTTGAVDVHRPFIDEVPMKCLKCKRPMVRVKDVADVWFDSGAMPFASVHYPFSKKELAFPADYIAEAVDQTRGWFYTLAAISAALGRGVSYKNVTCLGLILDKNGQKMSKSKGNIVDAPATMAKYGADAVRWYFYTINDPGEPKRFSEDDLGKVTRRFILIVYNSFVFWNSYAKRHETPRETYKPTHVLDRWILASLNTLVADVTKKLDGYAIGEAGRLIESFTDDLSRWYIRRSRDRFQDGAKGSPTDLADYEAASYTLQTVLLTLTKLIAPFMPFLAEAMYRSVGGLLESVHLETWPTANKEFVDAELITKMTEVRRLAAEALALRADVKIKVRQPLSELVIKNKILEDEESLLAILADEVNVKKVVINPDLKAEKGLELNTTITPALKEEGVVRELARAIQGLRQDAGYKMGEEITLLVSGPDDFNDLVQRNSIQLKKAVSARMLIPKKEEQVDVQIETKVDSWPVWLGVRR